MAAMIADAGFAALQSKPAGGNPQCMATRKFARRLVCFEPKIESDVSLLACDTTAFRPKVGHREASMTQRMLHVALEVTEAEAPKAAYLLAKQGVFSPEHSVLGRYNPANSEAQRYHDATVQARAKLDRLAAHYQQLPVPAAEPSQPPSLADLTELNGWLDEMLSVTDACRKQHEQFEREQRHDAVLLDELKPFGEMDLDLTLLTRPKRFIDTLIGSVPETVLAALTDQLARVGGIVELFGRQAGRAFVVVICPQPRCLLSRALLEQHNWREIRLPPEFVGKPRQIETELNNLCQRITQRVDQLEQSHRHTFAGIEERLAQVVKAVNLAEPYANLFAETVSGVDGNLLIRGWIPRRNLKRLNAQLAAELRQAYRLETRAPLPDERESVPSAMRYPHWLGPFAELVRGYGVPCYGDFDPTLFFMLSFTAMFGMMFGDVGHGLVIAMAALLLRGEARRFRPLLLAAGASACLFGLLYGSVFGLEDMIEPLWIAPLSDPIRMLQAALAWGVVFLVTTQLIMLYNRLAARDWRAAMFDAGGVAGLLLYLGGVATAFLVFTGRPGVEWAAAVAGAGFVMILIHFCSQQNEPWPARFFLSLIASLEAVFNDFVNTLSFMRVAAFSISHVALAMAIVTLSAGMGSAGQIVMLVLGNLLILVLEGSIVAIQALRLEYYEGFSRYFTCFGREFKPLVNAGSEGREGERPRG
jgi:V/A-type H+/Na+-transporting ATPase subunit I